MPLKEHVSVTETTGKQEAEQKQLVFFCTSLFRSEDKMVIEQALVVGFPNGSRSKQKKPNFKPAYEHQNNYNVHAQNILKYTKNLHKLR